MIRPSFFIDTLVVHDIRFFTGVPDSLLKNLCAYITDSIESKHNIIAANEGGAVALAAGYHLATGKIGMVYMQNSGEGNTINPLASLTDKDVYNIPLLLVIGWRGKPGVHDEPQHVKQGKVTLPLLETMGIPYAVLDKEEASAQGQILKAIEHIKATNEAYAIVIEKDTFDTYKLPSADPTLPLSREEAIQQVAGSLGEKDVIVSTTGMISRELFEYRAGKNEGHERDFLTVGSMGHASQIALGIALEQPQRHVWCFDGDGATIMHMGNMAIVGSQCPKNYIHVIFNNGAHDSVGGQPTVGLQIDLPKLATAMRYKTVLNASTKEELDAALQQLQTAELPALLQVCVRKGNRADLGRPTTTPQQNKQAFMNFLKQ